MDHEIRSDIAGTVWKVPATVGAQVADGEVLLILESMKLEIPVSASAAGTLTELRVAPGDAVDEDQVLAVVSSG